MYTCMNSKMQSPLYSDALQKNLTAGLCHCNYTCGHLLFIQERSDPKEMHCSSDQGKMQSPLFSDALQKNLTAGLCHCNYTYGHLLFIQECSDPTEMHCSTDKGKMQSILFSAALQKNLTAGLCHRRCTYGHLLFIQECSDPKEMHCSTDKGLSRQQAFAASCAICSSLLCCKIWILRFTAVLFCHKPGAFQGILPYAARAQHNSQVQPMLSPLFRSDSSFGFDNT